MIDGKEWKRGLTYVSYLPSNKRIRIHIPNSFRIFQGWWLSYQTNLKFVGTPVIHHDSWLSSRLHTSFLESLSMFFPDLDGGNIHRNAQKGPQLTTMVSCIFFSVWATQWMSYFGQNPPCSWIIIGYPIISPHPIISPFWWLIATATCLDGWLTIFDDWPQRGRVIRRAQPELRQHPLWLERGSLEGQG